MVKEITFWNGNLIYVIINVPFTFDFKKLLENELRFVTDVVLEYFAIKLKGFRVNFFKSDFSVYYFVFVYS